MSDNQNTRSWILSITNLNFLMPDFDLGEWEMHEAEALAKRLKLLVRKNGGNAAVAEKTGIKLSTLNSYLAGVEPKFSVVVRLAESLNEPLSSLIGDAIEMHDLGRISGVVSIPMRDVRAAAGAGAENDDEAIIGHMSFPETMVRAWGCNPKAAEAVRSTGDSMWPTIDDGAWVIIDRSKLELAEGKVFAFRTSAGLRLKRFQTSITGAPMLVSDNRDLYAPEVLTRAELRQLCVVGRVFVPLKAI